jgi:hypothetical protein
MHADEQGRSSVQEAEPVMTSVIVAPAAGEAIVESTPGAAAEETPRVGMEGEETIWEGDYSPKNFIGRFLLAGLLTPGWLALATYTWGYDHRGWGFVSVLLGIGLVAYWGNLLFRFVRARRSHYYRLTTKRLFVTTGFFRRRVDQMELIRLKDVYIQQTMIGGWLGVGNLVIITSEETLPKAHLLGIDEPHRVMNLIWHHMRVEQNQKTDRINPV